MISRTKAPCAACKSGSTSHLKLSEMITAGNGSYYRRYLSCEQCHRSLAKMVHVFDVAYLPAPQVADYLAIWLEENWQEKAE